MFRKCLDAGKAVTSCSMEFFRKVKATCASEFMSYASCLEKGDSNMEFAECRKTQAAYDNCVLKNMDLEKPHYGYHCLTKIHDTDRPKPVEEKPAWMDNEKARKLAKLPQDFPRNYKAWGSPGVHNNNMGDKLGLSCAKLSTA